MFRKFTFYDPNPNREWKYTPSLLGIVLYSGKDSRRRALENAHLVDLLSLDDSGVLEAHVPGSMDAPYRVHIDFDSRVMHCPCKSFEHREGPCKHITAASIHAVVSREGQDANYWMTAAIIESRNAGDSFQLWDNNPPITESDASEFGVKTIEVYQCLQPVKGYMMDNGRIWTGSLPLPEPGEAVLACLPNKERVPAKIVGEWKADSGLEFDYQCYEIVMDWIPEDYSDFNTVVFGSEMLRSSDIGNG